MGNKEYVITKTGRLGFFNLVEPDTKGQYADNKYKVDLIFDEDSLTENLKEAALKVCRAEWGKDFKLSDLDFSPFKDGDDKYTVNDDGEKIHYEGYKGKTFITAKTLYAPLYIGADGKSIDPEKFYSGVRARMKVTLHAFSAFKGKKGVTLYLNEIQLCKEEESFGYGTRPGNSSFGVWSPEDEEETSVKEIKEAKGSKKSSENEEASSLLEGI